MRESTQIDEVNSALVRGAQAGDEAAFERLVRRSYDQIYRWALARTGDRDDADDVTQEVLVRLHHGLAGFDGRSRFTTWLYRVMHSAAADLGRRRARRERLTRRLGRESGKLRSWREEPVEPDEDQTVDLVRTFMEELSGRQREVFDLVDLQGYEPAEVSRMLGTEPVTVRSHLFRARRAIRRRILESHPELVEGYGP